MPALAAAMASWLARPSSAAAELTRTTLPPAIIWRPAARTVANAVVSDAAMTSSYWSFDVWWAARSSSEPAQLTAPSKGPNCWKTASTAAKSVASTTASGWIRAWSRAVTTTV